MYAVITLAPTAIVVNATIIIKDANNLSVIEANCHDGDATLNYEISDNVKITLNEHLSITPFLVPHRDEYSETVGYRIEGPNKSLVFIPDIDKWQKWDQDIKEVVSNNTYSLLDGTFYDIDELPGRDMSEIPHPFIVESIDFFSDIVNKSGVHFIHLNHSNPALDSNSNAFDNIKKNGFHIALRDQLFDL